MTTHPSLIQRWTAPAFLAAAFAVLAWVLLAGLDERPALWWDEGWTLLTARNWVESGHYGRMLAGRPAAAGLAAHYPVVASVALSFRTLGVGVWQGRLPGALYTLGAFLLLFYLAERLYSRRVAWGCLFVLVLLVGRSEINPIMNGRQVLGDMPAAFFLLAGYTCLYVSLRVIPQRRALFFRKETVRFEEGAHRPTAYPERSEGKQSPGWRGDCFPSLAVTGSFLRVSLACLPITALFWGLALTAKAQTLPFFLLALILPVAWLVWRRRLGLALVLLGCLAGAWLAGRGVTWLQSQVLRGHVLPGEAVEGLFRIAAFAPDWPLRLQAWQNALFFCLVVMLGLLYASPGMLRVLRSRSEPQFEEVLRLSLWLLGASWSAWFLLFSNGGARYLASPVFLGSMFAAAMLADLSAGLRVRTALKAAVEMIAIRRPTVAGSKALFSLLLVMLALPPALLTWFAFWRGVDDSARRLAQSLNASAPPGALVESYDSEIFFFLQQPYHYPPDWVHVALLRSYLLGGDVALEYDPLAAEPDYLVVGPTSRDWRLYDAVIAAGEFSLLQDAGRYQLYVRNHSIR